jgi:ADP-ribose pyrophosphatase
MSDEHHPIRTLSSQAAWSCRWYGVRKDMIELPDGSLGEYNVLELPDAVWVVPVTVEGEIVLLRHYRYPLRRWIWELPAGSLAPGEAPLNCAQRELLEETGGTAPDWQHLMTLSTMKGIGTEQAWLYCARGVLLGEAEPEAAEVMTVHRVPQAEALRMARAGEIEDAMGVLALLLSVGS